MIVIIGGGISGLSAAWHLLKEGKEFLLFEAENRFGGALKSKSVEGNLLELGANSLMIDKDVSDFLNDLGFSNEVVEAQTVSQNRYLLKNKRFFALKPSPKTLLTTKYLSFSAKFSVIAEYFNRTKTSENESVASFFRRRFNSEIVDYLVSPFIGGIYAGDPEDLLIEQTFPVMLEAEAKHGSLLKSAMKSHIGGRSKIVSFKSGMQSLAEEVAKKIPARKNETVIELKKSGQKWLVKTVENSFEADKVILALPAYEAAKILKNEKPEFALVLEKINYPPMCLVHLVFEPEQIGIPLDGFGVLHPKKEKPFTAGCIWTSSVFEGKSDKVLLTVFVGGAQFPENTKGDEGKIINHVLAEFKQLYKIKGKPFFTHFARWEKTIPQYNLQQKLVSEAVGSLESEGLYVCANWHGGISVPSCIKKGKEIASRI
jgi:oxygen-dependent protoporphyrinogen oxidase